MRSRTKIVIFGVLAAIAGAVGAVAVLPRQANAAGQASPPAGSCGVNMTCRMKGATLTPGPLRVGGAGISTDGGVYAYGDLTALGSVRTYDSSNLTNNWRQSTFNGTTSFEQNGAAAYNCAMSGTTCTFSYNLATSAVTGTSITSAAAVTATTTLRSIGAATGSLPTCNAGLAGAIEYDTTRGALKRCNGSAWHTIGEVSQVWSAFVPATTVGTALDVSTIDMPVAGTFSQLDIGIAAAGVGVGTYTVDVFQNGVGVLCTSNAVNCTSGVGFSLTACTASFTAGARLSLRHNTAGCTTTPAMNISAVYSDKD